MHCELCLTEHPRDVACGGEPWTQVYLSTGDAEAPLVDLTGQTLGHYRLVRRLGAGGMGTVYLGEQTRIGARVAVKVLHPHLGRDESLRARFYAEARTVNVVGHPNIVHIFDINEAPGGIHYFVMEYLEGVPMSHLPRPMSPGPLVSLLAQACDALDAAHRCGVVHRDLKPDNLFVVRHAGEPPSLRVLDFGVAKARRPHPGEDETAAGIILGTPAYMAPEQSAGQPVDGRADIYALAVTAYYLATGQLPFERGQMVELALGTGPVGAPPPHLLVPGVPPALSEVLLRALARRCEDRYATALEFKEALLLAAAQPLAAGLPSDTPPPRSHTPVPSLAWLDTDDAATEPNALTPPLTWVARVRRRSGAGDVEVLCTELSRGGLFMCCADPFPRLFNRLEFTLLLAGELVECAGEVVRHVDAAQARTWGMPSTGVGVQFVNPSARLCDLIRRVQPRRLATPATTLPRAEVVL